MLDFFKDFTLPGLDPSRSLKPDTTDVASFTDLWLIADLIESCCLIKDHIPGWAGAGKQLVLHRILASDLPLLHFSADIRPLILGVHNSIGIFIWTTSSYQDRLVPKGVQPYLLANATDVFLDESTGPETHSAIDQWQCLDYNGFSIMVWLVLWSDLHLDAIMACFWQLCLLWDFFRNGVRRIREIAWFEG